MRVVVALEGRFALRDGRPASHHLTYDRVWRRYLEVFESVTVLARLFPTEDRDATPVEGPGVEFVRLAAYTGPQQYARQWLRLRQQVRFVCQRDCAYILRIPGAVGGLVWAQLGRRGHPYAVEVVGDPYDMLAPGSVRHPLRPLLRRWLPAQLRQQCDGAIAASYVTAAALQRRYPCPAHMTGVSDVVLPAGAIAAAPRQLLPRGRSLRLITVGDVNQLYKAPHVLIGAVARCVQSGLDLTLTVVGAGTYLPWLRQLAAEEGIGHRVIFTGRLPGGEAVRAALDTADVFVLPSFQEGLPRAMVEAMARGLPCIGSSVGGIGELLQPDEMVAPGDVVRLADKIREVVTSPTRMREMSIRNRERAVEFSGTEAAERRRSFYRLVRSRTESRLRHSPAPGPGVDRHPFPARSQ